MSQHTMRTLIRLADIAVEIDEIKDELSENCKRCLATIAWAVHEVVEIEAGERSGEIYAESDAS